MPSAEGDSTYAERQASQALVDLAAAVKAIAEAVAASNEQTKVFIEMLTKRDAKVNELHETWIERSKLEVQDHQRAYPRAMMDALVAKKQLDNLERLGILDQWCDALAMKNVLSHLRTSKWAGEDAIAGEMQKLLEKINAAEEKLGVGEKKEETPK